MEKSLKRCAAEWLVQHIRANEFSKGTIKNKKCYIKAIARFSDRYGPMRISQVGHDTLDDLTMFLRRSNHSINNVARTIDICKDVVTYAKRRKYVLTNEVSDYYPATRGKVKEIIRLEDDELLTLLSASPEDLENERANDVYLAQAITGMSYGDLGTYEIERDGVAIWLCNHRAKGRKKEYWVPLDKISHGMRFLEIHEKYGGRIPYTNILHYNQMIRRNAARLGIKKYLTSHTGRKTFATRMFEDGWSLEDICLMMGITMQVLTKHYIRRSRKRLEETILANTVKITNIDKRDVVQW